MFCWGVRIAQNLPRICFHHGKIGHFDHPQPPRSSPTTAAVEVPIAVAATVAAAALDPEIVVLASPITAAVEAPIAAAAAALDPDPQLLLRRWRSPLLLRLLLLLRRTRRLWRLLPGVLLSLGSYGR